MSKHVGNTYAASIMMGICSLVDAEGGQKGGLKPDASVCLFSYGSGAIATMYSLRVRATKDKYFSLSRMQECLKLRERLDKRHKVTAKELDMALDCRARMHTKGNNYSPVYPINMLFPDTFYLVNVDEKFRRFYDVYRGGEEIAEGKGSALLLTRLFRAFFFFFSSSSSSFFSQPFGLTPLPTYQN